MEINQTIMKKMKYFLLIAISAVVIGGCAEDKGNYNYDEVVFANIDPIPSGLVLEQFQDFSLELDMTFSKPGYSYDDFEYLWFAYKGGGTNINGASITEVDTLSRNRVLNTVIALPADSYRLTFRVTEKETGVYTSASELVKVINGASQGHVILCEVDGYAEVNFVNSLGEVKRQVFEGVNGKKVGRNPLGLDYSQNMIIAPKLVYIRCEDETGGSIVSPVDFSEFATIKSLFAIKPEKMKPQRIDAVGIRYYEVIINDGIMYSRNLQSDPYAIYWEPIYGDFYLSKFVFANNVSSAVIYDQKNRKFIRFGSIQSDMRPQPALITVADDAEFNPNNMGMDMLEGYLVGTTISFNLGRAVMKGDDGKIFLLSFTLNAGTMTPQRKFDITNHEGVTGATKFAFTTDGGFVYYNIGNKISYSSFTTGLHINTFANLIPTGQNIECLYIDRHFKRTELCVITNDGTRGSDSGSLFIFDIASDGTLTKKAEYMNCCGQVVDILYKN